MRCLNVDLVEGRLANVNHAAYANYEFREPLYGGPGRFVQWREELNIAEGTNFDAVNRTDK